MMPFLKGRTCQLQVNRKQCVPFESADSRFHRHCGQRPDKSSSIRAYYPASIGASLVAPASITIRAEASDPGGKIERLDIFA